MSSLKNPRDKRRLTWRTWRELRVGVGSSWLRARHSGCFCALLVLSTMPPVYKASSRIAFERTLPRYMQTNKVTNEPIIDDYDTLGQTYVISSESILLQVIRSLSLASDPDFVGGKDNESLGSRIRGLFRNIAKPWVSRRSRLRASGRSGEDRP